MWLWSFTLCFGCASMLSCRKIPGVPTLLRRRSRLYMFVFEWSLRSSLSYSCSVQGFQSYLRLSLVLVFVISATVGIAEDIGIASIVSGASALSSEIRILICDLCLCSVCSSVCANGSGISALPCVSSRL